MPTPSESIARTSSTAEQPAGGCEILELLWTQARKGNVSALKRLEEITAMSAAATKPRPAAKPKPLGKKEAANLEAQTAEEGTTWAELLN
jgi:hypothetical protein